MHRKASVDTNALRKAAVLHSALLCRRYKDLDLLVPGLRGSESVAERARTHCDV